MITGQYVGLLTLFSETEMFLYIHRECVDALSGLSLDIAFLGRFYHLKMTPVFRQLDN